MKMKVTVCSRKLADKQSKWVREIPKLSEKRLEKAMKNAIVTYHCTSNTRANLLTKFVTQIELSRRSQV